MNSFDRWTQPEALQRLEGLFVLVVALWLYAGLEVSWGWWLALLLPDLSMLGYLWGARVGAIAYNLFHTYALPLLMLGAGFWLRDSLWVGLGVIWAAHIGLDRALGYGLKRASGFRDTHLGRLGRTP
ncbi:DUF4260 domain-containing protein [Marinithermus hydrothermalis]|uniref:DUF4260 domain-containing protein n=1 Tax=Marinithermus hydrothermalis (strain DSM 14884 / JCM 11576 / T1) TaxID=869210 RepID=F2NN26_MARHT|nr:DUF4260 domain-containing protein [Marinithermus hydrothermalis]AEB12765.1 hypothetical protein Marky_2037 [Marinithermus hydrothermalis DSM 14884]